MGAMRIRMLFTRMEGQQTQWVVGWQTHGVQRERRCYSFGEKKS